MSLTYNKQELEGCLSKCLIACGFRDILSKTGIPADETVIVCIKQDDKIVAGCEVPKKSPIITVSQLSTDFAEEIKNFLDQAEAFNGMISSLPHPEPNTSETAKYSFKLALDIGNYQLDEASDEFPREIRIVPFNVCGPPWRICH